MAIVANVMTETTVIKPIDGRLVPDERSAALAARPVRATISAVFREQVASGSAGSFVPRDSCEVRRKWRNRAATVRITGSEAQMLLDVLS